mmetsp:Transcript_11788/g.18087  ORF Transcript_11788/g.18087 Transcript_11788/m.18087 type:complete len:116 (+) Transcript_11788:875-1222(+)
MNKPLCKLSFAQSEELLLKARDNMDFFNESHISKKLESNLTNFKQFRSDYEDYNQFKARQQAERDGLDSDAPLPEFKRKPQELKFTQHFLQQLVNASEHIDIDITSTEALQFDGQ